ncbi:neurochondrin-like [Corticium candelabrum]|uniref:neurochondrin-like n=1 Tax=Corticium candelabrum TaxID=121492 RepID=UPI002E26F432|nr:neurochondrin-like [Corticium candelabrum]
MSQSGLEQYLDRLRKARSDNEIFACLLVITRLVQANQVDGETRRRIFDAVGFDFLNRLIATSVVPEGCSEHIFSSLALTLLACFATDKELAADPQMLTKIPFFCEVIGSGVGSSKGEVLSMAADALHCLTAISLIPVVRQQLINRATAAVLVQQAVIGCDAASDIILRLACSERKMLYSGCSDQVAWFVQHLSRLFKTDQGLTKFAVCKKLIVLISPEIQTSWQELGNWQKDIWLGLNDILCSKITPQYCQDALGLARNVVEVVGMKWVLAGVQDSSSVHSDFILLLLHRIVVETKMCLDRETVKEVLESEVLVSNCFYLLEHYIHLLVTEGEDSLLSQLVSRLHRTIEDAIKDVISFLTTVAMSETSEKALFLQHGVVHASVRVLCVWMAEETASLKDIANLVPFLVGLGQQSLITLMKESQASSEDVFAGNDVTRFLLPAVCHLSSEDDTRHTLIASGCHLLLIDYFVWKIDLFKHQLSLETDSLDIQDTQAAVVTCCSALLNFCVMEPHLIASDSNFHRLIQSVFSFVCTSEMDQHVVLHLNCICLGLMILQSGSVTNSNLQEFFKKTSHDLGIVYKFSEDCTTCRVSEHYQKYWTDIRCLWSLAMQALSSCIRTYSVARQVILDWEWPSLAARWIKKLSRAQEKPDTLSESSTEKQEAEVSFKQLIVALSTSA